MQEQKADTKEIRTLHASQVTKEAEALLQPVSSDKDLEAVAKTIGSWD